MFVQLRSTYKNPGAYCPRISFATHCARSMISRHRLVTVGRERYIPCSCSLSAIISCGIPRSKYMRAISKHSSLKFASASTRSHSDVRSLCNSIGNFARVFAIAPLSRARWVFVICPLLVQSCTSPAPMPRA